MTAWFALLISVGANIVSNIAFKRFIEGATLEPNWASLRAALLTPTFWVGGLCAGVVMIAYLFAIRTLPLSIAYPATTALSAIGISLAGVFLFGESLKPGAIAGIVLVIAGVCLIAR